MNLLLEQTHPPQSLVNRARSHSSEVVHFVDTKRDPASDLKALSKELVQAHASFVDLLAADFQVEQVQPLVASAEAMIDAMVLDDRGGLDLACERMRVALIAWSDRNGWNS